MLIRTKLALNLVVQITLVVMTTLALLHLAYAYRELERTQWRRFESYRLVAELHQSSNELSQMARLAVLTGEARYAQFFDEIARMRNGQLALPADYDALYWDLVLADPALHQPAAKGSSQPGKQPTALSLVERMRQAGFRPEELALLEEAKRRSDRLMEVERSAMAQVEDQHPGEAALGSGPGWRGAVQMLFGPSYLKAKAGVMAPVREVLNAVQRRVDEEREQAGRSVLRASWLAGLSLLALTLYSLYSAWGLDRSVRRPLAHLRDWALAVRAGRMHSRIRLTDRSEFGELSQVIDQMAESVEHSVAELQAEVLRRTRAEEAVQHLANHDALTGLPSLRLLNDRLDRALVRAQREGQRVGLLFVDLNDFKAINDGYGHESGDSVLKTVAHRLADEVRAADTVGRIGGDEFVVVLPDVASEAAVAQVRDKLVWALSEPIYLPGPATLVTVSAAFGMALYPDDAKDAAGLLRLSDAKMYRAKAEAKGSGRQR